MKLYFKTRQAARTFNAKRIANGLPSKLDKGLSSDGSRYVVLLKGR